LRSSQKPWTHWGLANVKQWIIWSTFPVIIH